jgi:NNP family nitrate/nitrite transporter-like MFS transporter
VSGKSHQILFFNTLAFTVCFAVWMLNGVLVTFLATNNVYDWGPTDVGWLLGIPVLTGAIFRLPAGILTDRYGGKPVFTALLFLIAIPLVLLSYADSFWTFAACSFGFGLAGASFAIGIAFSSVWYKKEHQGTALGIFGAGNAGAAATTFLAPTILNYLTDDGANLEGWRTLPLLYAGMMVVMGLLFVAFTTNKKPATTKRTMAKTLAPLKQVRVWRFGMYYFLVFGCFVAFSQWLVPYFVNVYHTTLVVAGVLAALFSFPSGVIRALGGWMSDKFGARVVMYWVLGASIVVSGLVSIPKMEIVSPGSGIIATAKGEVTATDASSITIGETRYELEQRPEVLPEGDKMTLIFPTRVSWHEPVVEVGQTVERKALLAKGVTRIYFQANVWIFAVLVILLGSIWGIGKAAVYKHIPDYFPNEVGVVGGMVGVLGGLGGFVCPIIFGYLLKETGIWTSCWVFIFLVSVACLVWMHRVVVQMTQYPRGFESQYSDRSRVLPGDVLEPLLKWRDEYSVGVEAMDLQHKRLVQLINDLDEVIQKGGHFDEFRPVVDEVIDYTKTHFTSEEAYLEKIGYDDLENHKETHAVLIRQVEDLRREAEGGDPDVMSRFLFFLQSWLVGHIVGIDMKYSPAKSASIPSTGEASEAKGEAGPAESS